MIEMSRYPGLTDAENATIDRARQLGWIGSPASSVRRIYESSVAYLESIGRGPVTGSEFDRRILADEYCHAGRDGDCSHADCPQLRDGEPGKSGRHCPLDWRSPDDEFYGC